MELIKNTNLGELEKEFIKVFKGKVIHNFYNLEKYKKVCDLLIRQEKLPTQNNSKEFKEMETTTKIKIKGRKGKCEYIKEKGVYKLKLFLMPFIIDAVIVPKEDKIDDRQPDLLILKEDIMIGALWQRTSSKGKDYLTGYIDFILNDDKRLFINIFKTEDKKYLVYVNEPESVYMNNEGLPEVENDDYPIPF